MPADLLNLVRTVHRERGAAQSRAAARLMSLLEDQPNRLPELLQSPEFTPRPPRLILGLTGAPGAGKSSLADALIAAYRGQHPEGRVGVIAVDPTSPFTGGAVLGDRVRMMRHATDPGVFVRSMATRGHLGGLTLGVRGVIRVMELLGCELILIETVGVGQSEVEVAGVADRTLIVFAPGQGDSIQLLKAGLMEIGDLFVVNKADRPGAAELYSQMLAVLKLSVVNESCGAVQLGISAAGHHGTPSPVGPADGAATLSRGERGLGAGLPGAPAPGQEDRPSPELGLMRSRAMPEVFLVSALERSGLDKLVASLEALADAGREVFVARREAALREEVRQAILEEARRRVEETLGSNGTVSEQVARVMDGRASVAQLAGELLRKAGEEERTG